jgi:hypothetical protein
MKQNMLKCCGRLVLVIVVLCSMAVCSATASESGEKTAAAGKFKAIGPTQPVKLERSQLGEAGAQPA